MSTMWLKRKTYLKNCSIVSLKLSRMTQRVFFILITDTPSIKVISRLISVNLQKHSNVLSLNFTLLYTDLILHPHNDKVQWKNLFKQQISSCHLLILLPFPYGHSVPYKCIKILKINHISSHIYFSIFSF